jgi:hypothetical protein
VIPAVFGLVKGASVRGARSPLADDVAGQTVSDVRN